MSEYYSTLTQHPVGHGFFHTGRICSSSTKSIKKFTYIYDCGCKGKKLINQRIDDFLCGHRVIDLLVISHFHHDHISGIEHLLKQTDEVKTVVLPYLTEIERLCLVVDHLTSSNESLTYLNFLRNPVGWLNDNGVKNIIEVDNSIIEDPIDNRQDPPPVESFVLKAGNNFIDLSTEKNETKNYRLSHDSPIELLNQYKEIWSFKFLNLPADANKINKLKTAISKATNISDISINNFKDFMDIIFNDRTKLKSIKKAYIDSINSDMNYSSIIMLSHTKHELKFRHHPFYYPFYYPFHLSEDFGSNWLLTGDATLKDGVNIDLLISHYKTDRIDVFSLPHHGSRENFNSKFFNTGAQLYFATIPNNSKHHPNKDVVNIIKQSYVYRGINKKDSSYLQTSYKIDVK